ncbi:MAG: transcription elongation factor subunit Spt4 [Candidatus Micrarchaeia archaeon]
MTAKACKKCHLIVMGNECPACGSGSKLSEKWSGYVFIIDPEKSELAKKIGATAPGKYAIKVK